MTARRKTYLLWLALVTFVAIINGIFKNSLTQVLVMVTACYALYQLLKMDHVFDRKKRRENRASREINSAIFFNQHVKLRKPSRLFLCLFKMSFYLFLKK